MSSKFNELDSDTKRTITEIISRGVYFPHTGLGNGGWAYLYKHYEINKWKKYQLIFNGEGESVIIYAKGDDEAIAYYNSAYRLDHIDYSIEEVITTIRTVKDNVVYTK